MFEEDFERCFICQQPCKGLYCSSECRTRDKGTPAEAVRSLAPVRLTARLPDSLSPLVRPVHHISPSPKMPAHLDNSSSSSISSSPLHSPRTNPSVSDSPQKEVFDLPPPAFPSNSLAFPGSIPVRIPALVSKPKPAPAPSSFTSTVYPIGASIDTLRYGRKPGLTNSVTSPNALLPRCACGKPANHKGRPSSRERNLDLDSGFSRLSLGPSVTQSRHVSEGQLDLAGIAIPRGAVSGHSSPAFAASSSQLSRSKSDPAPSSPKQSIRQSAIAPMTTRESSVITPSRRASAADHRVTSVGGLLLSRGNSAQSPAAPPVESRGRSRDRIVRPREDTSVGVLNHPPDREIAPSRSRHRREERERERRRISDDKVAERERGRENPHQTLPPLDPPQIMPSWSRRSSDVEQKAGEGVAPSPRARRGTDSPKSPGISPRNTILGASAMKEEGREEERRRAREEIGRVIA